MTYRRISQTPIIGIIVKRPLTSHRLSCYGLAALAFSIGSGGLLIEIPSPWLRSMTWYQCPIERPKAYLRPIIVAQAKYVDQSIL